MPGRIHVSESTKVSLVKSGKGHWATPRSDKIVAKGKGELQTYWLQLPDSDANTRFTNDSNSTRDNSVEV